VRFSENNIKKNGNVNIHIFYDDKPKGKRSFERSERRWESCIKMGLKEMEWRVVE
jgi:hypothetical protein